MLYCFAKNTFLNDQFHCLIFKTLIKLCYAFGRNYVMCMMLFHMLFRLEKKPESAYAVWFAGLTLNHTAQ